MEIDNRNKVWICNKNMSLFISCSVLSLTSKWSNFLALKTIVSSNVLPIFNSDRLACLYHAFWWCLLMQLMCYYTTRQLIWIENRRNLARNNCLQGKLEVIITKKYHVFALMERFQLELIYLYFPPSFHQTVVVSPVGLSLL